MKGWKDVKVSYGWIIESESETCIRGCKIGHGESCLVVHFPKVYLAFCKKHGEQMKL